MRELFEYRGLQFARDTDARVSYVSLVRLGAHTHTAAVQRESDGIVQETIENLLEASSMAVSEQGRGHPGAEPDILRLHQRPDDRQNLGNRVSGGKFLVTQIDVPRLDSGEIQDIVYQG